MCIEKRAVSVVEMARLVGLSRSRFYQLVGSSFPYPIYDTKTRRPYYTPDLQEQCLKVRRRSLGIDGKPILFHQRKNEVSCASPKRSRRKAVPTSDHQDLVDGLRSLGMGGVSAVEVEGALKELGVSVSAKKDGGEVLRAVFLYLKRHDTSGQAKG